MRRGETAASASWDAPQTSRPTSRRPTGRVALTVLAILAGVARGAQAQATSAESDAARTVSTAFSYTGDLMGDVAGGARRGAAYAGAASAQVTLLLRPLIGWPYARLFAFVLGTHGGAPSAIVGDVQGVSGLEAPPTVRLEELWLQQNLLDNRLSALAGRYDLSSEFYRLPSAALFLNSSFGMGPELAQSGVAGPSIYPNTAVGLRVGVKPARDVVWRAAALAGVPVDRPGGGVRLLAPGDGVLLIGELSLLSRPDTAARVPRNPRVRIGRGPARPHAGKLALGAWYYTARFPDLADTLASGTPVRHRGSAGAYVISEETLWSAGRGRPGALTAFAQLGLGDARVDRIGGYLGGGLTRIAPFPGRAQDELGLAVAAARIGSHYARARSTAGIPTAAETTVELTYLVRLGSWLAVQPDVQYVIHPGGTRATRNALVPGLRLEATR